jgi:hypothetical protein
MNSRRQFLRSAAATTAALTLSRFSGLVASAGESKIDILLNETQGHFPQHLLALHRTPRRRDLRRHLGGRTGGFGYQSSKAFPIPLLDRIHFDQPNFTTRIEQIAAPNPLRRILHQPPLHRIRVHVLELFPFLSRTVHIEVIESRLPKTCQFFSPL